MPEPLIRARDLSKVYRSGDAELVIFSGLSFISLIDMPMAVT
ncbi:MAG: hypothetical protein ABSH40_22765 [Bryobacteraceae bacterium]|jgi:hypothetical protein